MEISAAKIIEPTVNYTSAKNNDSHSVVKTESIDKNKSIENGKLDNQGKDDSKGKKELNKEQLMKVNEELNHFMSLIDSNIQFSIHEKSKQLMVQVVDTKEHRVLKEFPSHEMLNIMANIKEYVGALLDKRA